MTIDEIIDLLTGLDGILVLAPGPGDGTPEIAWGDKFFYYSPDGVVPTNTQPFATVVTKDYPDDQNSRLNRPDAFRLNISAGKDIFTETLGYPPREVPADLDYSRTDIFLPHPTYAAAGWLSVVDPAARTSDSARRFLRAAYDRARSRYERRTAAG
ncbi:DUF6194 family protein [Nocardia brasiliensis]|uniref:DUF6194 family protein n=1 Tax=Nocardia brasiliensis TaxID=37326 RepID=UPI0004A6FD9B|nr:DUF6194 family protein [Nocardia brasiliensis]